MFTELTDNGIEYTYDLTVNGATFILWPTSQHSPDDVKQAKKWLRDNLDVVSIKIADQYNLDYRYATEIFEDPRTEPLKWYQVNNDHKLIRKERRAGTSVTDYVTKHVLPFTEETEKAFLALYGTSIYLL